MQLVRIQPVVKYDNDNRAMTGMARTMQWGEPGTPLSCEVVNTGRVAVSVQSGNLADILLRKSSILV